MTDMTVTDEMVEAADEAACKLDGIFRDIFNQEERHDLIRTIITAALAGHVVVPLKPTPEMLVAGLHALVSQIEQYSDHRSAETEPQKFMCLGAVMRNSDEIKAAWQAMITARPITRDDRSDVEKIEGGQS